MMHLQLAWAFHLVKMKQQMSAHCLQIVSLKLEVLMNTQLQVGTLQDFKIVPLAAIQVSFIDDFCVMAKPDDGITDFME